MEGICRVFDLWAVGPHQSPTASTCVCHRKLGFHATSPFHVGLHHIFLLCAGHCARQESGKKRHPGPSTVHRIQGPAGTPTMCQAMCLSFLARLTGKHIRQVMAEQL